MWSAGLRVALAALMAARPPLSLRSRFLDGGGLLGRRVLGLRLLLAAPRRLGSEGGKLGAAACELALRRRQRGFRLLLGFLGTLEAQASGLELGLERLEVGDLRPLGEDRRLELGAPLPQLPDLARLRLGKGGVVLGGEEEGAPPAGGRQYGEDRRPARGDVGDARCHCANPCSWCGTP